MILIKRELLYLLILFFIFIFIYICIYFMFMIMYWINKYWINKIEENFLIFYLMNNKIRINIELE